MAFIFVVLAGFAILLLVGSILFRESLPTEQRVAGGIQEAIKNYKTLLKDKAFLGQCGIQCFAFGAFFCYISGSSLCIKIFLGWMRNNLVIYLASTVVVSFCLV